MVQSDVSSACAPPATPDRCGADADQSLTGVAEPSSDTMLSAKVVVVSGTSSGVGKTSVALGIMAAARCATVNFSKEERCTLLYLVRHDWCIFATASNAAHSQTRCLAGCAASRCKLSKLAQVSHACLFLTSFAAAVSMASLTNMMHADFLDPMHHVEATGRPSINLDGWMLNRQQNLESFWRHAADADVCIVEGCMGLFDGRDGLTEAGSTAELAKWLGAPVLLVMDCGAMARSAAAMLKGYQEFDLDLNLAGVVFNKVGSPSHSQWLSEAVKAAGVQACVVGGLPKVSLPSMHKPQAVALIITMTNVGSISAALHQHCMCRMWATSLMCT